MPRPPRRPKGEGPAPPPAAQMPLASAVIPATDRYVPPKPILDTVFSAPTSEFTYVPPEVRIQHIRENMALVPEGREILKFADENGISIKFDDDIYNRGKSIGVADAHSVLLNEDYSDTRLTLTLLHELRHTQHFEFFKRNQVDNHTTFEAPRETAFTFMDPRAQAFQMRLMEGDAFTFQTMAALKLKQLGRPEFYDEMKDSESATIKEYIAKNPPESFKDEKALARGLFTHLQLHGLKRYDEHYFGSLGYSLKMHPDALDTVLHPDPRPQTAIPLTSIGTEQLGKLYGAELMSGTSLKALQTGVMQSYSPYDRETIKLAARLPGEAATLTQQEYAAKSEYIQARIEYRDKPQAVRDAELTQKFGAAAHKYAGNPAPDAIQTPGTALLEKAPVLVETPATVPATSAGALPTSFSKTQEHAGKSVGVADVAIKIAQGNYTAASLSAGQQLVLSPGTYETAAEFAKSIAPLAKGLGQIAKKIPLIGAAVTVGYVGVEVVGDLVDGKYGKAAAATAAGTAEIGGNFVGFGAGDAAREVVRGGVVAATGDEYAPEKSGIRKLVESGVDMGSKFVNGSPDTKAGTAIATNNLPAGIKAGKLPSPG